MFLSFGKESPEIKNKRFEALKKAYQADKHRLDTDPNSWWNKVKQITFDEGKSMPHNYLVKYIDMMNYSQEYYDSIRIDSRDCDPRYAAHKDIWTLMTDKQREAKAFKLSLRVDVVDSPSKMDPNLLKVQPRNVNIPNYNFEQYREFTKLYNTQMEKDRQKQYQIKRIFKYIKENPDQPISKSWKRRLLYGEKADDYNIDKFVDPSVSIDGFKPPISKRLRRVYIRTRTSRDITNYDCWRCYDRKLVVENSHLSPTSKIQLTPTELIHCFGTPLWYPRPQCSGEYVFEDNNLDIFMIAEPHSTTFSRGDNKADEYYEEQLKRLKKHKREPRYPTPEQFWASDTPKTFFLYAPPHAEYRKFKVWIRNMIREGLKAPSLRERAGAKYGGLYSFFDDYEKDYARFNEHGASVVPILSYSWADFLTKDEKKALKNSLPELPKPAEYISPERGTKVEVTLEQAENA